MTPNKGKKGETDLDVTKTGQRLRQRKRGIKILKEDIKRVFESNTLERN